VFSCLAEAKVMVEDFRQDYNRCRPHRAHGMMTPPRSRRAGETAHASAELRSPIWIFGLRQARAGVTVAGRCVVMMLHDRPCLYRRSKAAQDVVGAWCAAAHSLPGRPVTIARRDAERAAPAGSSVVSGSAACHRELRPLGSRALGARETRACRSCAR
jgi:hypothetical protein